jgi:hypothetical protein
MTSHISFYDSTGKITGMASAQPAVMGMLKEHSVDIPNAQLFVEGEWFGKDVYIVGGVVTDRPQCTATLSGNTLSGLPVPCEIKVNGSAYACGESSATLEFNQPGTYAIKVIAWPYLDGEFSIVNPA